jgi:hypothetical protein
MCALASEQTLDSGPWTVNLLLPGCGAGQTSEITDYWLSATGGSSGDARSFYRTEFTLAAPSTYQLR